MIPHHIPIEEALEMISDLIQAMQLGTKRDERDAIDSLCEQMSGVSPTTEQVREYIDADA